MKGSKLIRNALWASMFGFLAFASELYAEVTCASLTKYHDNITATACVADKCAQGKECKSIDAYPPPSGHVVVKCCAK